MSDNNFVDGIIFKLPTDTAPDFVKGKLSINLKSFGEWIRKNGHTGWINLDLKVSKDGKPYAILDTWKPDKEKAQTQEPVDNAGTDDQDLPF